MAAPSPLLSVERKAILVNKMTTLSEGVQGPNLTILLPELRARNVLTKQQADAIEAKPTPFQQMSAVVTGIITSGTEQNYEHFLETLELPNVGLGGLGSVLRNAEPASNQQQDGNTSVPVETRRPDLSAPLSTKREEVLRELKPELCQRAQKTPMKQLLIKMESKGALTPQEVVDIQKAQSTPYDQMSEVVNHIISGTEGHYEKLLSAMRDKHVGLALLANMLKDAENV